MYILQGSNVCSCCLLYLKLTIPSYSLCCNVRIFAKCWHLTDQSHEDYILRKTFWSIEGWVLGDILVLFHGKSMKMCPDSLPPSQSGWFESTFTYDEGYFALQRLQTTCQLNNCFLQCFSSIWQVLFLCSFPISFSSI